MAHPPIVTTEWLEGHLNDPNIRVIDIRGSVSTQPDGPGVEVATYRGSSDEYQAGHIPGAVFVDWTSDIVEPDGEIPVQLASPERFARVMAERGVGDGTHVIAVDHMGGQFATRLWWALLAYGHEAVSVLDGGWNRWVEEARPIETEAPEVTPAVFTPRPREGWIVAADDLLKKVASNPATLLIDARDAGQYTGTKRRGPRGGHIPGAIHLPRELFFAEGGGFHPIEELKTLVEAHGLSPQRPIVAYCNGGVAATVVLFNLHRLGFERLTNYDGSWNEWAYREDLPVQS